ncbi:MAG: VWA domain-containing protein, partial [Burkholderiales bacterium]|nr:VWA domain-containing protein [Burkholderiales bacterium]
MTPRAWPAARGTLHWPATLAAKGLAPLAREHLRQRAAVDGGELHCVVLDASGSMQRGAALARAKGVALDLLERAVRRGHQVALLALAGGRVLPLAPPQPARRALAARLAGLGGGGGTPLAQALALAQRW